jgi:hypothetical protein
VFFSNANCCTTNTPLNVRVDNYCGSGSPGQDLHDERPSEYCDGFKSMHPGVVNFVMCDASLHSLSDSIDYQVFNAMGTKAGGEVGALPP